MNDDPIWNRIDEHTKLLSELRREDAKHAARLDSIEQRTDRLMGDFERLRAEGQAHHKDIRDQLFRLSGSVERHIGGQKMGMWLVGVVVAIAAIAAPFVERLL